MTAEQIAEAQRRWVREHTPRQTNVPWMVPAGSPPSASLAVQQAYREAIRRETERTLSKEA